ncbi:hypothetical protein [Mixta calida]|uniref:hypothetical protein n=1 Tax=Mixta calida TaxID=665913 RepID=UPI0034D75584
MKMTNEARQALIEWLLGNKAVSYQKCTEFQKLAQEIALAALTAEPAPVVPEGWQLVPLEPTQEMRTASNRYKRTTKTPTGPGFWRAMIEAAPVITDKLSSYR